MMFALLQIILNRAIITLKGVIIMNPLNFKNQRKVLNILIDMCNKTESGVITEPQNFESNFPFLDGRSLGLILDILHEQEFISLL